MNFLIMAGGTGGHIFPALAVAQYLQKQGHHIVWLGSENAMETRLIPQYDIPIETLAIKGIRGNGILRKLALPFTLIKTIKNALAIIKKHQIHMAIGFGGFVTFPGGVAAKIASIPLIIHEQNAVAGLANRALSKIATRTLHAFPNAFPNEDGWVGNPVRQEIANLPTPEKRFAKRSGCLNVLIIGGSLGAKVFNEQLPAIMAKIPAEQRPNIRHQCGRNQSEAVKNAYHQFQIDAECSDFIHDMPQAYADADFVICRAGASTVAELSAAGLGGFLIPFPHAVDDHQTANAQVLVQVQAAECIQQKDLNINEMAQKIQQLTRKQCLQQAQNARTVAKVDATKQIAQTALSFFK